MCLFNSHKDFAENPLLLTLMLARCGIDLEIFLIFLGLAALYARKLICHFTLSVADVHDFCTSNSLLLFLQLLRSQTLQAAELSRPLTR